MKCDLGIKNCRCTRIPSGFMTDQSSYKPGDPAPKDYLAWHTWAAVQHKAGLRQHRCEQCGRWKFPQEWSKTKRDICLECERRK